MSETWKVETWREEEQEDSCSSCSSYLLLESFDDTEIITEDAECVPGVPSEVERSFLLECLLEAYRQAMEGIRQLAQEDGGAPGSVPHDTDTNQAQDTDTTQTQDTQDTQATH